MLPTIRRFAGMDASTREDLVGAVADALDALHGSEEEDEENEQDETSTTQGIDDNFKLTICPFRA